MVCLTSCVFRSIRFSGFARPHFGVRRVGELYTHAQGGGKGGSAPAQDGHKLGKNSCLSSSLHRGRAPADSRGPTGRFPPHAEARTSHVAHVAGFGPRIQRRPALPPREAGRATGGAVACIGTPRSPSPPPSPCEPAGPPCIHQGLGCGRRAGRTRRRAHTLPNARRAMFRPTAAKAATRPIRRASPPATLCPSGLPPPAQKSPRPEAALGCGLKEQMQVLIYLTSRRPGGGRRWP